MVKEKFGVSTHGKSELASIRALFSPAQTQRYRIDTLAGDPIMEFGMQAEPTGTISEEALRLTVLLACSGAISAQRDWRESSLISQLDAENTSLRVENRLLQQRLEMIEQRLANLEASMPKEHVVMLREITEQQARQEIRQLFAGGETLYYSDIAERLGLRLDLVVRICQELQDAGEIEVDGKRV
ncbi:MAG: hypothetical protein FJ012_04695 [Chloroflexi bacterium]|nr:hypothetical protein [Chloroflexota bacterium]